MRIGAGFLIALGIALYIWQVSIRPAVFELYAFNTPGAPSFFIRTEDDCRILINGGANSDIVRLVTKLLPFYSRRIDQIVATDDDPKHITGLIEMLNRYDVGSAVLGNATSSDVGYGVFLDLLSQKGIESTTLNEGDYIAKTPVRLIDKKRAVFTLSAGGKTVLLAPFNPNTLSKKIIESIRPDYLIHSTTLSSKPADKEKQSILASIMNDRRYNIRKSGSIKVTVKENRIFIQQ